MFVVEISGKNDNSPLVLSSVLFLHYLYNKALSQIVLNVSESIALEKNILRIFPYYTQPKRGTKNTSIFSPCAYAKLKCSRTQWSLWLSLCRWEKVPEGQPSGLYGRVSNGSLSSVKDTWKSTWSLWRPPKGLSDCEKQNSLLWWNQ